MSTAVLILTLAVGWAAATGSMTVPNLLFGAGLGAVALLLIRDRVKSTRFATRLGRVAALACLFTGELIMSAVRVAVLVARPDMHRHLRPGIIAFPLTVQNDAEIATLANLITLTPGTLSVDVSEDRRHLYVHAINVADREALIREIAQGFEAKVAEAFR